VDLCCWEEGFRCRKAAFLIGASMVRLDRFARKTVRASRECPIIHPNEQKTARWGHRHAMRLHEWGTQHDYGIVRVP
jgi:hypothetical protein